MNESDRIMSDSENLVQLVNRLLVEKHFDGILVLFQDSKNVAKLKEIYADVIEICKTHLTDDNFKAENNELYFCCEDLLIIVAKFSSPEGVLFELLEIIETTESDNVFTTVLKALQITLLQMKEKSRSLEWSLGTIKSYLDKLPYPNYLSKGYDEKEEKLIEQDDQVRWKISFIVFENFIEIVQFFRSLS